MAHVSELALAVMAVVCVLSWLVVWSRRKTPWRGYAVLMAALAIPAVAGAGIDALSYARPLWAMWDMSGEYRVIGAKLIKDVGIYLYVDTMEVEPRSVSLPWNKDQAKKLQDLMDEPANGGQFMMQYEFSWDRNQPQFHPLPQPPILPEKERPPAVPRFETRFQMKSNYAQIMDWVFLSEGGYAERDSEPGGAVNMGITFAAYREWWEREKHVQVLPMPTWNDLKTLTRTEAEHIYQTWFFDPLHFGQLPAGVDYAFVDFAVNSGVGGAIRAVQRFMRFPVTGKIDTNGRDAGFFWALRSRPPFQVVEDICAARLILMVSSRKWERFKKNWTSRIALVKQRAEKMIDKADVVDVKAREWPDGSV